jgi:hypothetical protein
LGIVDLDDLEGRYCEGIQPRLTDRWGWNYTKTETESVALIPFIRHKNELISCSRLRTVLRSWKKRSLKPTSPRFLPRSSGFGIRMQSSHESGKLNLRGVAGCVYACDLESMRGIMLKRSEEAEALSEDVAGNN